MSSEPTAYAEVPSRRIREEHRSEHLGRNPAGLSPQQGLPPDRIRRVGRVRLGAPHVAWADTPEGVEVGWVCTLHATELSTHWPPLQTHEPGPDCGMPGALWFFEENVCRCPEPEPEKVAEREVLSCV